jgi:hypothetical protein
MDLITLAVLAAQALTPPQTSLEAPTGPVLTDRFVAIAPPPLPVNTNTLLAALAPAPGDTLVEYSDAYYKRLQIHRIGSYAMLPLFAFQYIAGSQLYDKSFEAPGWAKTGHRIAATGIAVLFTSNTITGVMNLYEGRKDPNERGRKVFHAVMMLAADAGFVATGILAERAEGSGDDRELHRAVALTSVGVATIGYLTMLDIFRKD